MQTLLLLLQLLQVLLHDLQLGLVLRLHPACLPQGLLPFLILLGRELQGRAAGETGDRAPLCIPLFPSQDRIRIRDFRRGVKPWLCCWPTYSCELQRRCSAYLGHAFNLLLPLPNAQHGPIHLLLLQPQLLPGLVQQLPVLCQLLLLGFQLAAPDLQLCLLLGWAQGKPMHYLPCPGHYLRSSQVMGEICPC